MDDGPLAKRRRLSTPEPRRLSNTSERPSTANGTDDDDDDATSLDPSDAPEFIIRRGYTVKRSGDPPKNDLGRYVCRVDERCKNLTFSRRCEWGKHMDKHERPYRCDRPECVKLNGFTYSGGLLRHQREVHRMHGSTNKLFCPEANCKRAAGSGFTRKENLYEHLRRVHRRTSTAAQDSATASLPTSPPEASVDESPAATEPAAQPRAPREADQADAREQAPDAGHDMRTLRQQIAQRDKTIRDQHARIQSLEKQLEALGRGPSSG